MQSVFLYQFADKNHCSEISNIYTRKTPYQMMDNAADKHTSH